MASLHSVWWHHCGRKQQHPDEATARQIIADMDARGAIRPGERLEAYAPATYDADRGQFNQLVPIQ